MKDDLEFQEKMTDLQLQMAMLQLEQQELEEAMDELADLKGQGSFQPPEAEKKMFLSAMSKEFYRQKRKKLWKGIWVVAQKVSVFLLIFLVGLEAAMFSVEAFREPIIQWMTKFSENSVSIRFLPQDNLMRLQFDYLPRGYHISTCELDEFSCVYTLKNEEENVIYVEVDPLEVGLTADTEDAVVTKLSIKGYEAMGIEKEGTSILIWATEQFGYILNGNIVLSELVKIAEKLEVIV